MFGWARKSRRAQNDLIYDVGMHAGHDTDFYLSKGFRVVAIEANPTLASAARQRFADSIRRRQLTILNVGITDQPGVLPFYINEQIDEWSSFNRDYASRGFPVREINVEICTISDVVNRHGVPYYAKIDIEGYDHVALRGFLEQQAKPRFISYENPHPGLFEWLVAAGYSRFKVVSQLKVPQYKCPLRSREGRSIEYSFLPGSSGPFGEDTPGDWMDAESMRKRISIIEQERLDALKHTIYPEWFDMHAGFD